MVLEKTLESPLDYKDIKPGNSKGNQSCIFIGRTDAEAPILWLPNAKNWLIGKDPDAGKDWGQEEKGTTGWDGWMASPTQWTRVWVNSGSWWWTGRLGVLPCMGLQRVGHDWATERNGTDTCTASTFAVLVSSVQQNESATRTRESLYCWISFPFRSPRSTEWSFPCSPVVSH